MVSVLGLDPQICPTVNYMFTSMLDTDQCERRIGALSRTHPSSARMRSD
jgi:hypothetical protein